jgi:hypothetical protein
MAIKAWKSSFHWKKVESISTQICAWVIATHPCMFFGLVISFQNDPILFYFKGFFFQILRFTKFINK